MLLTIIIGLIAGALAKFIMPGKDPGGIIITILLGIGGALLAGFLGRQMGWYEPGEGAGIIGAAAFNLWRGLTGSFRKKLKLRETGRWEQRVFVALGVFTALLVDPLRRGDRRTAARNAAICAAVVALLQVPHLVHQLRNQAGDSGMTAVIGSIGDTIAGMSAMVPSTRTPS